MTEEQIIQGCKNADNNARRELYERYGKVMYGVCCRYIKDATLAEDILHDGFITVFSKIKDYRGDGSFEGWCRRVFITTALTHLRHKNPINDSVDLESQYALSNNEASAIEKMSEGDLKKVIDKLPEGYRTILNLYAVEGYSHKEIASMLDINENTSRSQYSRARIRLSELLSVEQGVINEQ